MNSNNPRFYPKHLAKKYAQQWNEKDSNCTPAESEENSSIQQVAPALLDTNINGQSTPPPVGGNSRIGFKSSEETSPSSTLSSSSLNASSLDSSNTSKSSMVRLFLTVENYLSLYCRQF